MDRMIQAILGILIVVIILISLTPVILEFTTTSATSPLENLSASSKTIVNLVPLFWVLLILGVVVGGLYLAFKTGGHR